MRAKVSRWGNSIGVRVPAPIVSTVGLRPGMEVEFIAEGGAVRLIPRAGRRYTLKALIGGITKRNLHGETATGRAVGAELIE